MSGKIGYYRVRYGESGSWTWHGRYVFLKTAIEVYREYVSNSRCNMGAGAGKSVELVDMKTGRVVKMYRSPSARGLAILT